ncbi:MAG: hypothetical protein IKF24_05705 [Eubacterium sp.]|nr:hypothetical protein [Eubacterium sp.]
MKKILILIIILTTTITLSFSSYAKNKVKPYKINTKYFKYLGYTFKNKKDINKCFPKSKLISKNTKYYPFKYKYKSGKFTCFYECEFDDELDKSTYEYDLDYFKCPIKKIVNIKMRTKYSKFVRKLAGKRFTNYDVDKKKHKLTLAYKTFKYYEEESKSYEKYYVLWRIKLDRKNRVKPSSVVSFTDSEENIVN